MLEVLPSLPGSLLDRAESNIQGSLQLQLLEAGFGDLQKKVTLIPMITATGNY